MSPITKIIRVVVGIILIIIGLIGGLIPIFQGWVFGIPGLMLLGSVFPSIKRATRKILVKAKKKIKR
ncbi:MAG: hypothetical protein CMG44_02145 [Candidatus Marinimicrobia bacterium]|nr:hypothetical protein [Candidatus Neomarinimicrobiota bacterium]